MGANEGGLFGVENNVVVVLGLVLMLVVLVVATVQYHGQGGQVWGLNPETELPGLNYGCASGNGCGGSVMDI